MSSNPFEVAAKFRSKLSNEDRRIQELRQALEDALIFIDYLCDISTLRNKSVRMMAGYHNIERAINNAKD